MSVARSASTTRSPALFTLPAPGRILVTAGSGTWVAYADGSRRLLGTYDDASWSPFGRYIAATRANELVTLDTEGTVRWTLARPGVRFPRWTGSATNTRIAYLSGNRLHVVAGDGKGDFVAGDAPAAGIPPAWSSSLGFILAYADTDGRVHALITAKGGLLWAATPPGAPQSVEWSSDGRQLLVLSPGRVSILDGARGHLVGGEAGARRDRRGVPAGLRPTYAELHRSAAGSRVTLGRTDAVQPRQRAPRSHLVAGRALAPRRLAGVRPVGVHPRRREQDRGGVEHLGPVPLAGPSPRSRAGAAGP